MNLIEFSARRPIVTLCIAAVVTLIAVFFITRLRPESALDAMLNPNDPSTAAMGRVMADFPVTSELLLLASLPSDAPADSQRLIGFAERFSAAASNQNDLIRHVRFQPDPSARAFIEKAMAPAGLLYLDASQLQALRQRLTPAGMTNTLARAEAMLAVPGPAAGGLAKALVQDPLRLHEFLMPRFAALSQASGSIDNGGAFFSPSGRDLLIRIEGTRPPSDLDYSKAITDRVNAIAASANTDGAELRLSGAFAIAAHNADAIRHDAVIGCTASVVTLAGWFLLLYHRPVRMFVMAFVPVALGLVWGFGLYAMIWPTITPLAAVVGGALGGIGIDYSIYKLAHHRAGQSPAVTVRRLFAPSFAAWFTSVIGFIVIAFSPLRVLRDFAVVGSLGLLGAWIGTLLLLPAMLTLFAGDWPRQTPMRLPVADWLWMLLARRPRSVFGVSIALVLLIFLAAAIFGRPIRQNGDMHLMHPQPNPPLEALDEINTRMGVSADALVAYVRADNDEQLLARCYEVQRRLQGDPAIRATLGPATLLPEPSIAAARETAFSSADAERAAADFRTAVENSNFGNKQFGAYGDFLKTLMRPPHVPTIDDLRHYEEWSRLMLPRTGGHEAITLILPRNPLPSPAELTALLSDLRQRTDGAAGVTVTGMSAVASDTQAAARRDLPRVIGLAGGLIAAYLAVHFRSFTSGAAAVLPSVISLLLLLSVMRLFGVETNLVNLVMVPLLMGMNVDYGIFAADVLRHRHTPERRRRRFVYGTAALLGCCGTAMLGFASLATVAVPAVRSLGVLVTIGVGACMLATMFLLWPIVLWQQRRQA